MPGKYTNFGFGVAACVILSAVMIYVVYMAFSVQNKTNLPDDTFMQESFSVGKKAQAVFYNEMNEEIGMAQLEEGANGVLIRVEARNLPAGLHAIHIHETAQCTPIETSGGPTARDYFEDAGSHLNPYDRAHGLLAEGGPHAGDLMNIYVHENGEVQAQLFNDRITLAEDDANVSNLEEEEKNGRGLAHIFDADGAALIIHSGTDDYQTSPTGRAGDRIACAVIEPT